MENELIPNPTDRILCVKIGKVKRDNIYEMARKYWVVNLEKASRTTHVLAIIEGIVEAVYLPISWKMTEDVGHEGRCEFIGTEDRNSIYLGKSVKSFYGFSSNPVKYINM